MLIRVLIQNKIVDLRLKSSLAKSPIKCCKALGIKHYMNRHYYYHYYVIHLLEEKINKVTYLEADYTQFQSTGSTLHSVKDSLFSYSR